MPLPSVKNPPALNPVAVILLWAARCAKISPSATSAPPTTCSWVWPRETRQNNYFTTGEDRILHSYRNEQSKDQVYWHSITSLKRTSLSEVSRIHVHVIFLTLRYIAHSKYVSYKTSLWCRTCCLSSGVLDTVRSKSHHRWNPYNRTLHICKDRNTQTCIVRCLTFIISVCKVWSNDLNSGGVWSVDWVLLCIFARSQRQIQKRNRMAGLFIIWQFCKSHTVIKYKPRSNLFRRTITKWAKCTVPWQTQNTAQFKYKKCYT